MKSARAVALLVAVALLAGGVVASSAFTTATVDRDAGIDVVSDDTSIIALDAGPTSATGGIVTLTNGELDIDFGVDSTSAAGVNPNATYVLGASGSPTSEYAFNITNLDDTSHDLTLAYSVSGTDSSGSDNVVFDVYDSSGTTVATVTEEDGTVSLGTVGSGSTLYVVMTVDTANLDSSDDLSGTLTVSA